MKNPEKKDKQQAKRDEAFRRHFGKLSMEAAQISVEAYFDEEPDKSLVLAWLRHDKKSMKEAAGDVSKEERNKLVGIAMAKATHQLQNHPRMQRYRDLLPR